MTKASILIVEDQVLIAREIQDRLQSVGYRVLQSTTSAEEALVLAQQLKPDLVLMDIRLEGPMDGIQGAERLRAMGIPSVFLTAYSDPAILERAKLSDSFGYILKPFETRELEIVIEIGLYKHRMEQERLQLIARLQAALAQVKTLAGLLPICAYCKKIKDDAGYWQEVERYIMSRSQATFSHGMCPGRFEKVKRELDALEANPGAFGPILS